MRTRTSNARLEESLLESLYGYFHPVTGGPEGQGWPFGRPVYMSEVYLVLQRARGTELVDEVRLFAADPVSGDRGQPADRIERAVLPQRS